MLKLTVLVIFILKSVACAFFDLTEIDDPLALFWNTKDALDQKNQQCLATSLDGTTMSGVCIHPSYCLLSGGRLHGYCGFLSTCCTYQKSCGRTTKSKVSYFSSGTDALNNLNCEYNIQLANENVCQVRLDFEIFRLSPASPISNTFRCVLDSLVISPNPYGIPQLCGNNDDQHVYVHLGTANNVKQVILRINLANRATNVNAISNPAWRIKVTQLECPRSNRNLEIYKDKNFVLDYNLLAPEGAIQYFTNNSGTIKSFGFDNVNTQYAYSRGERYAIAFKRTPDICGIRFTPTYIKMKMESGVAPYTDSDCLDYLFVPELSFVNEEVGHVLVAKVCLDETGTNTAIEEFTSTPPGPLYIHFVSDSTYSDSDANMIYAFYIQYNLLASC